LDHIFKDHYFSAYQDPQDNSFWGVLINIRVMVKKERKGPARHMVSEDSSCWDLQSMHLFLVTDNSKYLLQNLAFSKKEFLKRVEIVTIN
jgi:hypothetical protein